MGPVHVDVLRRLRQVAAGEPEADLPALAQLGQSPERVHHLDGMVQIGHQDRGADADWHARRDGGEDHDLAPVARVVVDPDTFETVPVGQLGQLHELIHGVPVRQVNHEL